MFDPLHKWLGIPPDQQPPDLYRLLGITPFESDEDVIHAAADKQLAFLHDLTNGAHAAAAEDLSNQVSAARVILVNKKRKAAYDAELNGILTSQRAIAAGPPPPIAAAVADHRPPAVSGHSTGWYLRHGDKRQHGPFEFAGLLEAARAGNIVAETEVRHPELTHDQWVTATSIPDVSKCCNAIPATLESDASPVVVVPQPRRPARHYRWQTVVRHLFSFLIFFVAPSLLIYQNPRVRQLVNSAMGKDEIPKSVTVVRKPTPKPTRAVRHDEAEAKVVQSDNAPVLERREPSFFSQPPRTTSTPEVIPEIAEAPTEKLVHLKLDLQSTRWIMPLEDTFESGKYFISTVTDSPGTLHMQPSSGELSQDHVTRLTFDGMSGLAIELRLASVGDRSKPSVTGQWTWQIGSKTDLKFSLDHLERKAKDVHKECTSAANRIGVLDQRRQHLNAQVKSAYNTPLRIVRGWEREIAAIKGQIKQLNPQAEYQQKSWEQFRAFSENVHQIQNTCELVLRNVPQP